MAAVEWDDENKAQLIKQYEEAKPTPETSSEIVADLAEEFEATVNGVRIILSRAGVYVKKWTAKAGTTSTASGEKKESKADSLARLTKAIEAQGIDADDTIISKMTGKAAAYFAAVIAKATEAEETDEKLRED